MIDKDQSRVLGKKPGSKLARNAIREWSLTVNICEVEGVVRVTMERALYSAEKKIVIESQVVSI
jgi:hypothetical protein